MNHSPFIRILSQAGFTAWLAMFIGFSAGGCSQTDDLRPGESASDHSARSEGAKTMTLELTSSAFAQGHPIPKKYTGEGADVSPPLAWSGVPEGTKELVLICDDPDAPTSEPWVHWVIYKIPVATKRLPEGIPRKPRLKDPPGTLQGKNSWPDADNVGYRGPMPPPDHGVHHYYFKLYAIEANMAAEPLLCKKALLEEIKNHVLAEGVLMGTYER